MNWESAFPSQSVKPTCLRLSAIPIKTLNQIRVSKAAPLPLTSFQVSTPSSSRAARPRKATVVASSPRLLPPIQSTTKPTNTPSRLFSCRDRGPILASSVRAKRGTSGVFLVSGRITR
ncbi:hypothetical protein D3C71_1898100 [compost metagenome]